MIAVLETWREHAVEVSRNLTPSRKSATQLINKLCVVTEPALKTYVKFSYTFFSAAELMSCPLYPYRVPAILKMGLSGDFPSVMF